MKGKIQMRIRINMLSWILIRMKVMRNKSTKVGTV
jgi:hypothetical protein